MMNTGGYLDYLGSVHAHADICIVLPVLDIGNITPIEGERLWIGGERRSNSKPVKPKSEVKGMVHP